MHLRTVRARLLMVSVVGLTVALIAENYFYEFAWWNWQRFEPCLGETLGACGTFDRNKPVRSITLYGILLLIILLLYRPVSRWVSAPVRDLVPLVTQIGPQNLGLRIPEGRTDRDVRALTTALNSMLDRLAAGYEGQRSFAANASHEMRTPLALQRMIIEVAMAEPLTAEQSRLVTGQLLEANERSERIIEGLLTLSQAQQGIVAHSPQQLDEIVGEVVTPHRIEADAAGITLITELDPYPMVGDRILLERLVRNLVHNALKYNRPGGTVRVTLDRRHALTVTNTGPVVPVAEIPRLFEPFTRLGRDRIDHSGGSGLGLSIVRAIVRSHDGSVDAEPGPDGGLRVTVRLPL
ncbi:sensor histidine kinase [Actinoplanes sp. G11-F43]|uniref:sensor histidine kinase n=1 Tax=Actinoplanes sp. G11-F43 TaxID=3424130 RepID=UPI003D3587CD